jgi:Zn finger protein HypA/HybF involved in hydrogenase expression
VESSVSVRCKDCGETIPLGVTVLEPSERISSFKAEKINCPVCHQARMYDRDDLVVTALPEGGSCYEGG